MDYSKIKAALEAAITKAEDLGTQVSIAIVDEHGDLIAFQRMEKAIKISPEFSIAKAYTSGTLGIPTSDLAQYATEGKPYFGINTLIGGKLTTIPGGVPVKNGGILVGGVGVGGSYDVNQDVEIAQAAIDVL